MGRKQFGVRRGAAVAGALLLIGAGVSACGTDDEPTSVSEGVAGNVAVGTHPVGSSYHSVGTAVASLISSHTPIRAAVQPFSGPNAWIPAMVNGDLAMGVPSSVDTIWAYEGGPGYDQPNPTLRVVNNGAVQELVGLVVLADSSIRSVEDLRGKRVGSGYGGNVLVEQIINAQLEAAGLSQADIKAVPVPDSATGVTALQSGQVDAAFGLTPTTPNVVELDSTMGVRVLPFSDLTPDDIPNGKNVSERKDLFAKYIPGVDFAVVPGGTGIVDEDFVALAYSSQLVSDTTVSNETIFAVVEAVWNNHEELHSSHATGKWTPEDMVPEEFRVPYHDGAVEFYKSVDAWTEGHEATQNALLD